MVMLCTSFSGPSDVWPGITGSNFKGDKLPPPLIVTWSLSEVNLNTDSAHLMIDWEVEVWEKLSRSKQYPMKPIQIWIDFNWPCRSVAEMAE